MTGTELPERWLVVDLKAKQGVDAFRHLPMFDFVCDPSMPTVSCPQPGGHHRFEFALTDDARQTALRTDATVQRLISRFVDTDQSGGEAAARVPRSTLSSQIVGARAGFCWPVTPHT